MPKPAVTAYVRPYAYYHDRYSAYYREGLRRHLARIGGTYEEIPMGRAPRLLGTMRRVRYAHRLAPVFAHAPALASGMNDLAAWIEGPPRLPTGIFVEGTSHYRVTTAAGARVELAVDAHDDGAILEPRALAACDVYFKTNYWPTRSYAPKVRPLVNGDPSVIPELDAFRAYRAAPKRYDVCMVVRVWGGHDEVEGVEHNLRLLEAVARTRCTKFLYAYLVAGDVEAARRRLERQGIPCGTEPLPSHALWRASAEARLNVIRLGMHHCVPWRVTGALAMGSAIVLDRAPFSRWPEPLREGTHFLSLGVDTGEARAVASDAEYATVPDKLLGWLGGGELAARVGHEAARYYDGFMDPERVGEHILTACEEMSHIGPRRAALDDAAA